jgi:hypothetical protein
VEVGDFIYVMVWIGDVVTVMFEFCLMLGLWWLWLLLLKLLLMCCWEKKIWSPFLSKSTSIYSNNEECEYVCMNFQNSSTVRTLQYVKPALSIFLPSHSVSLH